MGPWSPLVHAFLRHLAAVGFAGAPRLLGVDGDFEVLSYISGDVPADPNWQPGKGNPLTAEMRSADALVAAARLIRDLHRAAAGFEPPAELFRNHSRPPRIGEIMSQGDIGPWNTVYRGGLPIAFIDWDNCGPVDPVIAIVGAAWGFVPLGPDRRLRETGFDPLPDIGDRLRLFVDAYGLTDRSVVLPALTRSMAGAAAGIQDWGLAPTDTAVSLEFIARELRWLGDNAERLERALR
jgi:hypothetical protein